MIILQQILILLLILIAGFAVSGVLFWLLFKKNAPTYDEIKDQFLVDMD